MKPLTVLIYTYVLLFNVKNEFTELIEASPTPVELADIQ
jgi:hypothetical protein